MSLFKKILTTYKVNFVISSTLAGVLILLSPQKDVLSILGIVFGVFVGTFILDAEFFTYSYVTNPTEEFSQGLRALMGQKNYAGALAYIRTNRQNVDGSMTRSVVFQIVLFMLSLYVIMTLENSFSLAFVLSAFIESVYQMFEDFSQKGSAASWFWLFKECPSKKAQNIYLYALCGSIVFILALLS
ncbi:MAG: hypothetical protein AAB443_03530 [Patescibacteria group bacterium]